MICLHYIENLSDLAILVQNKVVNEKQIASMHTKKKSHWHIERSRWNLSFKRTCFDYTQLRLGVEIAWQHKSGHIPMYSYYCWLVLHPDEQKVITALCVNDQHGWPSADEIMYMSGCLWLQHTCVRAMTAVWDGRSPMLAGLWIPIILFILSSEVLISFLRRISALLWEADIFSGAESPLISGISMSCDTLISSTQWAKQFARRRLTLMTS